MAKKTSHDRASGDPKRSTILTVVIVVAVVVVVAAIVYTVATGQKFF
ncbi:hypothetical protein [Frondihabitans cladoniiphilus]|uniref:Uncharacterized protein n=1 Tax=Frondihabitans cladoniiphilus TaxID=715785 RepID=A0ABP8VSP8_9MICO